MSTLVLSALLSSAAVFLAGVLVTLRRRRQRVELEAARHVQPRTWPGDDRTGYPQ